MFNRPFFLTAGVVTVAALVMAASTQARTYTFETGPDGSDPDILR